MARINSLVYFIKNSENLFNIEKRIGDLLLSYLKENWNEDKIVVPVLKTISSLFFKECLNELKPDKF